MAFVGLVFLGFIIGALVVLAVEGLSFYLFIFWIRRKAEAPQNSPRVPSDLDSEQWLTSACKKQGIVWFLEHENIPKVSLDEPQTGAPKELRMKKVIVQVHPMKKYAKIKDRLLILFGSDGSQTTIKLLDYTILAVSSSSLPSKKWAKKYPIILESRVSSVCNGSKTSYLYFDTSWEKESWCKALRLASSHDKKLLNWYNQISQEFNSYLASLNTEFPSFLKPSAIPGEVVEKTIRVDGSSSYSKARIFLKKIAKKASKGGVESRENTVSSTRDVRRTPEKLVAHNDIRTPDGSVKSSLEEKCSSSSFPDLVQLGNKGLHPTMPDIVCDDKLLGDEGTLCLNLLLSRLFFDAKRSAEMKNLVKMRIQKALSNLRTPIYVRGLACANLDLGNLPPYIHKIRVLPMDLTEVWAVEVDIEYLGGLLLNIETRIEVREPELQDEIINASSEPSYNGEASSLLEGIEHYSKQLNFSASLGDQSEKRDEEGNVDTLRQSKISSQFPVSKSKWKTILHSIAEQVSQVPLSLAIKITSLRGTLRFHIRQPPSDQLWFGFTSMPDIDWHLESSVGERKITNSHIALLISSRFKVAVRDNLVLPNCESLSIPWMLAEKDDWVPQKAAPFVRINQESIDISLPAVDSTSTPGDHKPNVGISGGAKPGSGWVPEVHSEEVKDIVCVQLTPDDPDLFSVPSQASQTQSDAFQSTSSSSTIRGDLSSAGSSHAFHASTNAQLLVPLLSADGNQPSSSQSRVDFSRTSTLEEQPSAFSEEDKAKRMGRRARMMDLGKKVGEKLEEKRRHIEEKSRHIVEKMRENSRS